MSRIKHKTYGYPVNFDRIRAVFFPKNFHEKYKYLGEVPHREGSSIFKAVYPLVLAMDYEARPKWCPRWVLRLLHLYGSNNSVVRVRNTRLRGLKNKLTRGIMFMDYKTKWEDYDLRLSIHAPEHLQDLARDIQSGYYSRGRQKELVEMILKIDPNASIIWGSVDRLVKQYNNLTGGKEVDE